MRLIGGKDNPHVGGEVLQVGSGRDQFPSYCKCFGVQYRACGGKKACVRAALTAGAAVLGLTSCPHPLHNQTPRIPRTFATPHHRLTNLVKTSATPGPAPAPSRSRSSSAASLHQGQNPDQHQDHATTSLHGAPPAASGGPPGAWPARQPMPGPRPGQTAAPGVSRDSFLPPPRMAGSPPPPPTGGAKWSGAPSSQDMQQRPFGPGSAPRPPGVEANKSSPISGAGGAAAGGWGQQGPIQGQPQSTAVPGGGAQHFTQGAGGAFGSPPLRSATASPAFGESDAATVDPTRSPAQNGAGNGSPNNATGVPGAGAAVVAKRLVNRGPPDGGVTTPGKGVPHVSSAPVLSGKGHGGSDGRDSSGNDGGGVASGAAADAGGGGAGKGGKVVEQAPKSEPRKGAKGKNMPRRASAGPAAVAAKPGRLAKMMSKWLYPEAKVSAALGLRMYRAFSFVSCD